jgi:hypothetical protein
MGHYNREEESHARRIKCGEICFAEKELYVSFSAYDNIRK